MKITANRREDIERRRAEYDAETQKYKDIEEANSQKYRNATHEKEQAIEKAVSELIGPTNLVLEIRVDTDYDFTAKKLSWKVYVRANEHEKFEDTRALAWSWEVKLGNNGELIKDSSSWSGLKAITPEQVADLEESVRVIKVLNNIDWPKVLDVAIPRFEDFHDEENYEIIRQRGNERPDFENELTDAVLEESLNGKVAFKLKKDEYWNGNVYIIPTGLTDKFVKGYIFSEYSADARNRNVEEIKKVADLRRTKKDNLAKRDGEFITLELN